MLVPPSLQRRRLKYRPGWKRSVSRMQGEEKEGSYVKLKGVNDNSPTKECREGP
jgi:hypothetical protein